MIINSVEWDTCMQAIRPILIDVDYPYQYVAADVIMAITHHIFKAVWEGSNAISGDLQKAFHRNLILNTILYGCHHQNAYWSSAWIRLSLHNLTKVLFCRAICNIAYNGSRLQRYIMGGIGN